MNDIAHNEVQNESSKIVECLTLILGMGVACSMEIGISKRKDEHECCYNWTTLNSTKTSLN